MEDKNLAAAIAQSSAALSGSQPKLVVKGFFDEPTFTASHVAYDPATKRGAIIDSVLDYDPASGRTSTASADQLIAFVRQEGLTIDWLLETHAHADHISAAPYLKEKLGGKVRWRAAAGGRVVDLTRAGLGVRHKSLQRARNRGVGYHQVLRVGYQGDRCEIADRIVWCAAQRRRESEVSVKPQ